MEVEAWPSLLSSQPPCIKHGDCNNFNDNTQYKGCVLRRPASCSRPPHLCVCVSESGYLLHRAAALTVKGIQITCQSNSWQSLTRQALTRSFWLICPSDASVSQLSFTCANMLVVNTPVFPEHSVSTSEFCFNMQGSELKAVTKSPMLHCCVKKAGHTISSQACIHCQLIRYKGK